MKLFPKALFEVIMNWNLVAMDMSLRTPGVGDGQGGLACCDSWSCKESDTTEQLN